jgi:hypothetical protein
MLEPGMRDEEQKKRKIRKQMVGGGDLKGGGRRGAALLLCCFFFFLPRAGQPTNGACVKKALGGAKKAAPASWPSPNEPTRTNNFHLLFFFCCTPASFFFLGLSAFSGSTQPGQWDATIRSSTPTIWYDHSGTYRFGFVDSSRKIFSLWISFLLGEQSK